MIFGKWAQLSRGILRRYYARRGAKARVSWVRFSRRLLQKEKLREEGKRPAKTTPMERWSVLASKALERIRSENEGASWLAGARAMRRDVLEPARKKKTMAVLGRWKALIDGVLGQAKKKKSMTIAFKWRRIVNQLLKRAAPMSGEEKTRLLGVYGRWRIITRGILDKKEGKRGRAGTRHLTICAKWFKMADRMLCRHDPAYRKTRV